MAVRTIWEAMARRRFLLTSWPWRGLSYVLSTPLVALLVGIAVAAMCLPWFHLASRFVRAQPTGAVETVLVGLAGLALVVAGGPLVAAPVARLERLRLRIVDADPVLPPTVTAVAAVGRAGRLDRLDRLRRRYTEPPAWRELAYLVVVMLAALPSAGLVLTLAMAVALIAGPLLVEPGSPLALGFGQAGTVAEAVPFALVGAVSVPVALYLVGGLAGLHATAARALLSGSADERLRTELVEVSRSRERLVTAFEAERRRIERDLHDGAQQRLVGLILQLGLAKVEMPPDAPGTESVANAHDQAKLLLTELREFIHGIHPQVLSDLGLPSALQELADRSATPVTVECTIPQRPSAAVEGAGYFVVAEALSNAGKHSGATEIRVAATVRQGVLTVDVTDNGRGGADARHGSGLTGLADRAAALGGTLSLSSPVGGPTTVRAEFPCR